QIIMTDLHWEIVEFLQRYDDEYAVVLSNHTLTRVIFKKWGAEKGNTGYLYGLYPGGPATQAARIGGLTKPSKCI
ncbi:MAG: TusE/DsrC/DsvC family sulfur relay protein, partial [Candidatus Falkowbacteria bacterium]|nr:TusE/DsrC/DsvC family sulfur relay protein [Candidatus Falkowbacteria bacterium]